MMNAKERKLVATLLDVASATFANHGCNDVPTEWFEGWTEEEMVELDRKMHEANGDPEVHDPNDVRFYDFALMGYFGDLISEAPE